MTDDRSACDVTDAYSNPAFLTFLGELRAGADVRSATVVAEMSIAEGEHHAAAERRGEYADVVPIDPTWAVFGGVLSFGRRS